ncbi:MAG: tRNA (N6-isopentenyl adenosine(37)-C2)-methylthiotransferase MiaB, partial [Acetatifactor sp.]|nr:tRNA (N6-isopentenyl adenosine(37)-C2)-methylthiotransferase MiaB [Acetatifactor sp.]
MDTNVELDKIDITGEAPLEEPARQYYFMAKARRHLEAQRERLGRPLTAAVTTFGCQMNARDSEKLSGILEEVGYALT